MKVYISGKITGLELHEAERLFEQGEDFVRLQGHEPINPMKVLPYADHLTWKDYMVADLHALLDCDAIYMLDNWESSKGATLELHIANGLGLPCFFQPCPSFLSI